MKDLFKAEVLKLATLRATYLALAITAAGAAALTALITHTLATGDAASNLSMRREILTIAGTSIGPAIALLLGMLIVGSEFRHNTLTPVLLITPVRRRVILAKASVAACTAVVVTAIANLAGFASAAVTLNAVGSPPLLNAADVAGVVTASLGLSVLYSISGVAIATLIRNPTTALIATLSALYVVDPIASLLIPGRILPGGASEVIALSTVTAPTASPVAAVAVLVGYATVLAFATLRFAVPRDIS